MDILTASREELLDFLREQQKICFARNRGADKELFLKNSALFCGEQCDYTHEKEILFMIKHSASLRFIAKYFGMSTDCVEEIAIKNKCYSQLLANFSENTNSRCFSRSQILRACEEFNYICPMCFKPLDITDTNSLTGHHIQPFARGGKTTKDNCLPLHVTCHFDDFKLLHSALFDSSDPIYSAQYFNMLKDKLQGEKSGMDYIIKKEEAVETA